MTKVLATALVAFVGFAGVASASTLTVNAQNLLDDYGFSVDADTLTSSQIAGLHFVDDSSDQSDAQVRAEIASIIK